MENADNDKEYKSLNGLLYHGFSWLESKEGEKFWVEVYKLNTAPYSDLKHLDLSYVPEPAKPPVMWRKIDKDKLPTDRVVVRYDNLSLIYAGFLGIDEHGFLFLKCDNTTLTYDFTHYIPLSDLINLPIQP